MKKPNKYKVIIDREVYHALSRHVKFLAQVSIPAAKRLASEFEKAANSLREMPERCPMVTQKLDLTGIYRALLFEKRYRLIFKVERDKVFIDAMQDTREDNQ